MVVVRSPEGGWTLYGGGDARVGKLPKMWEKVRRKWEEAKANVDGLDLATWHNRVI